MDSGGVDSEDLSTKNYSLTTETSKTHSAKQIKK